MKYDHCPQTGKKLHPAIRQMHEKLQRKQITRRDFVYISTLLGLSLSSAQLLAACSSEESDQQKTTAAVSEKSGKYGGVLRFSMPIQKLHDPAAFNWNEVSNVARHICEYLVITGPDNITRPYLAQSWQASEDLKQWTFFLRRDVKWNNGDPFGADDALHTISRWLDPKVGSSNIGLFGALTEKYDSGEKDENGNPKMATRMRSNALEKLDEHTIRLNLASPVLSIAENFYNYPTAMTHREWGKSLQPDLSANPVGTGPYTLVENKAGERAILARRDGYWGERPYLDRIEYYDHGPASSAQLAAIASGQVDAIYEFDVASYEAAKGIEDCTIYTAQTAQTAVVRMNIKQKPFDNKKLRLAMQACVDPKRHVELIYQNRATTAEHHHVAQIHPEYYPLPEVKQDYEKAKRLLREAGYSDGIEFSVDCGNTNGPWQQQICEILKEQFKPAGIRLNINLMPAANYWDLWDKTPLGITAWTHRPLGTMVLTLGYRAGVPWNETGYNNPVFDAALDKAESLVDVQERREQMRIVQKILQDDAIFIQPLWQPKYNLARNYVKGFAAHPTQYHQFQKIWIDKSA